MTLSDIIANFRLECPEINDRVISDTLLKTWAKQADKEVCAVTRCIVSDYAFDSVANSSVYLTRYDLSSQINNFYDIDDFPGGGVSFNDVPLDKTTVSELDNEDSTWRTRSAGTPEKYYRRGKYLYFDYPILTAGLEIRVYCVLTSDDFIGDDSTPYNGLEYLSPYHYAIVKYLVWKAKSNKPIEAITAKKEYDDYLIFMKHQIGGNKFSQIRISSKQNMYHNPNIGR